MNFAAATTGADANTPLKSVQLDALVVLKIIKHCRESQPNLVVTGQLLGLDVADKLEVTNCFPFPTPSEDGEEDDSAEYQLEMMKCLRDMNVDNNAVGWYQSAYFGSHLDPAVIESQFNYQTNISKSVVIIYDPIRSSHGNVSLRAYRLSDLFMSLYKEKKFTLEGIQKRGLTHSHIFEEIPITIHNSVLVSALLLDLQKQLPVSFDQLELVNDAYLERNFEFMGESVDAMVAEQYRYQQHLRSVARQQQQQQQYLQKKRYEANQRAAAGEPPLPEEDVSQNPIFQPISEPSRLEALLVTHQIDQYCQQINQFAGQLFPKLFLSAEL